MNSAPCDSQRAEQILSALLFYLSEAHLSQAVQKPMEAAAQSFGIPNKPIQSHKELISVAGNFFLHLSWHSDGIVAQCTEGTAKKRALFFLNHFYESNGVRGFEAALLDAKSDFHNGIQFVLDKLKQSIVAVFTEEYRQYIIHSLLPPDEPERKEQVVKKLFEQFSPILPDNITQRSPKMFVDQIIPLIQTVLHCEEEIKRILGNR